MQTENNSQNSVRDEQGSGAGTNSTGNPATGNAEETILNAQEQDEPLNETGMILESDDEAANMDEDESGVEDNEETETAEDEETGAMDEELSNEDFEQDGLEEVEEESDEDEQESEDAEQTDTHAPTMKGL